MGFQRATWHSGLTYKQVCRSCQSEVTYDDYALDFRPWYADGFVYCPKCHTPLRHNENFAISNAQPVANNITATEAPVPHARVEDNTRALFCSNCGKKFNDEDNFCSGCGNKR